jgi:hypothetical protein
MFVTALYQVQMYTFCMLSGHSAAQEIKHLGDFQKNEDFSFSENNLNIKCYERKVNILKQAQW